MNSTLNVAIKFFTLVPAIDDRRQNRMSQPVCHASMGILPGALSPLDCPTRTCETFGVSSWRRRTALLGWPLIRRDNQPDMGVVAWTQCLFCETVFSWTLFDLRINVCSKYYVIARSRRPQKARRLVYAILKRWARHIWGFAAPIARCRKKTQNQPNVKRRQTIPKVLGNFIFIQACIHAWSDIGLY